MKQTKELVGVGLLLTGIGGLTLFVAADPPDPGCFLITSRPCRLPDSNENDNQATGSCRCPQDGATCPFNYTKYLAPAIVLVDTGQSADNICYKFIDENVDCWELHICPNGGIVNCKDGIIDPSVPPPGSCSITSTVQTHTINGYWVADGTCDPPTGACVVSSP